MRLRYNYRRLFKSEIKLLTETAFHESGHACFSYFAGFKVKSVSIDSLLAGNGLTTPDYGLESDIVTALFALKINAQPFNSLSLERKMKSKAVSLKLIHSLVAGPLCEAHYISLRDGKKSMNVVLEHSDFIMSKTIEASLNNILLHNGIHSKGSHIQTEINRLSNILDLPVVWHSVEELSFEILNSRNYKIMQSEIELILTRTGLIDLIKSYQ